jgi:Tfp pilus assembly protein PilX
MNHLRQQQGSVIVFSVLLLAVILTISLGMLTLFIPKLRTAADTVNSTIAIYAADSAAEMCIYELRKAVNYNDPASTMNDATLDNAAGFTIQNINPPSTYVQADCSPIGTSSYNFRAVGTYRGVSRALEITQ